MSELYGIDVSKHQGVVDWSKVKSSGVQFAIIRAGYGRFASQEDNYFDTNMTKAINAGIPVGVYWYSYATTVEEARQEASVCLSIIAPYKEQIELPVFFDQEYEDGILALNNATRTNLCKTFIEEVEKAGYKGGLYASYDWFMNKIDRSQFLEHPAWVAQYGSVCKYTEKNLHIWQRSSTGRVSGITGNVDINVGYFELSSDNKAGKWKQNDKGWWWEYEDGTYPTNAWKRIDQLWYYFDEKGYAVTGWYEIKGAWYYFVTKEDAEKTGYKECACMSLDKST